MTSLDIHVTEETPWVGAMLDVIVSALSPHDFFGPLSYRLWEPDPRTDGAEPHWVLAVFPTPFEHRGGAEDGCRAVSGFTLDQKLLQGAFSSVNALAWHMPTRYNGDLDGPELRIRGVFCGRDVWLRIFHMPPPDEAASHVYEPATGRFWAKQDGG